MDEWMNGWVDSYLCGSGHVYVPRLCCVLLVRQQQQSFSHPNTDCKSEL